MGAPPGGAIAPPESHSLRVAVVESGVVVQQHSDRTGGALLLGRMSSGVSIGLVVPQTRSDLDRSKPQAGGGAEGHEPHHSVQLDGARPVDGAAGAGHQPKVGTISANSMGWTVWGRAPRKASTILERHFFRRPRLHCLEDKTEKLKRKKERKQLPSFFC